jgi:hypothetical protein
MSDEQASRVRAREEDNVDDAAATTRLEDDGVPAGFVKRRRVVVRSVKVKKSDLVEHLMNRELGAELSLSVLTPDSETVLSGPHIVHQIESSTITKCRVLKPAPPMEDLPDEIVSATRPQKKTTVLLWSKRRFLKRLYELKRRAAKK